MKTEHDKETVVDAVFALCKHVVKCEPRRRAKALLDDLQVSSYANGKHGRGAFGQAARHLGDQFSGYVILDAERSRLEPSLGQIPELTTEERLLLTQLHSELVSLNRKCVQSFSPGKKVPFQVVDPYSALNSPVISSREAIRESTEPLLPLDLCQRVAEAYRRCTLSFAVGSTPTELTEQLAAHPSLGSSVMTLARILRGLVPQEQSERFTEMTFAAPPAATARRVLVYHAALASLRNSLQILNQLVFQACLQDRLPTADDDNVAAIRGPSESAAERRLAMTVIPTDVMGRLRPGWIAYVAHPSMVERSRGLAEIVVARHEFSQETGQLSHYTLHLVDDSLTPSPLVRRLCQALGSESNRKPVHQVEPLSVESRSAL